MSGALPLKRYKHEEVIMQDWEAELCIQLQQIPSMEIRMNSYPKPIAVTGEKFAKYGGAAAIFVVQNLLSLTNRFCEVVRLNLNGKLCKLIRWVLVSGESATGKSPATDVMREIISCMSLCFHYFPCNC